MSDVTVIGLGTMGASLAEALIDGGYQITVWNRTASKAAPLIEKGAVLADDPGSAIKASPIFIVCVLNYEVTNSILSETRVTQQLPGKVMIQLSSGKPQDAVESERWAHSNQLQYLSGEIMVYPDQIGTESGAILIAGEESVYQRCEPLLKTLAGKTVYLGSQISAPLAYGMAMGSILIGALLGAVQGAQMCQVEGINLNLFASRLAEGDMDTISGALQDLLKRIQDEKFDDSLALISIGADGVDHMLAYAHQHGLNSALPEFFVQTFSKAIDAGLGDEDMAAMIKVWRGNA